MQNQEWIVDGPRLPRRAVDLLLLAVAAWSSPIQIWANNPVGVNYPGRLVLVGLAPWVVASGAMLLAQKYAVRRGTALSVAFTATVLAMRGGPIVPTFGVGFGLILIASTVGIVAYLVSQRENQQLVIPVLVAASLVLVAAPIHSLITTRVSLGSETISPRPSSLDLDLVNTPHIFIVVPDAYAGKVAFELDFGITQPSWESALTELGFEVPGSAWTSYSSTEAALPSLLDMSYPLEAGVAVGPATRRALYDMIGGDNRLVAELKRNGYRFVMVEAGWSGSSCGPLVDECVPAHFLDEATFWGVHRTLLNPIVLDHLGYSNTIGTHHAMEWLLENASRISTHRTPHLVFAHLLAPHPPFFLDASCRHRFDDSLSGLTFRMAPADLEARKDGYLEQAACIDRFLVDLAKEAGDSLIVYVSDHGTDIRNQLTRHPASWDERALLERMNILLAVRGAPGCLGEESVVLPNVFRRLLSCLAEAPIRDLPPRMFTYGGGSQVVEVDAGVVLDLVGDPR